MDNVLGLMTNTKNAPSHQPLTINHQPSQSIPAHNYAIYSIVFSPDGKYFATASRDKTIKIWDANNLNVLSRINKESFDGHINSVNKLMWTTSPKSSPRESVLSRDQKGLSNSPAGVVGSYLISASDDRKVMVWEIAGD